ncbi:hypothetical protein [Flavobacterium tistrianum]|uniref:hypothetical protein n=1 Tax=Flavobacterium tistrianum TaxID=1685414 RepID=UPI000DADC3A8|nr:hypothetical protein [Flavobacterium tistrianum]KAF2339777.1 hypothetical protein DMB71_15025 [Flavobacterium tistrianum]
MQEENEPIQLLVGNIVAESYLGENKELKKGAKHFSGGTKVYIINWYPGTCETIVVAGIQRKTKKIISICIKVNLVENLRIKTVYKRNIIGKVKEQHYQFEPEIIKELAETMLETIPQWQKIAIKKKP